MRNCKFVLDFSFSVPFARWIYLGTLQVSTEIYSEMNKNVLIFLSRISENRWPKCSWNKMRMLYFLKRQWRIENFLTCSWSAYLCRKKSEIWHRYTSRYDSQLEHQCTQSAVANLTLISLESSARMWNGMVDQQESDRSEHEERQKISTQGIALFRSWFRYARRICTCDWRRGNVSKEFRAGNNLLGMVMITC